MTDHYTQSARLSDAARDGATDAETRADGTAASGSDLSPGASPSPSTVLDALNDEDCRRILSRLDDPLTAAEISDRCEIPLSTVYRKVERLADAALVEERTEIRSDGHHATAYVRDFEAATVRVTDGGEVDVEVADRDRSPEERLEDLWTAVRREA